MKVRETEEKVENNIVVKKLSANKKMNKENKVNESPNTSVGKRMATESEFDKLTQSMQDKEWKVVKRKKTTKGKDRKKDTLLENTQGKNKEDQSDASMEVEEENTLKQVKESVTVLRETTNEVVENNQSVEISSNMEKRDKKEAYWNRDGILMNISEIDANMRIENNERFKKDHGGPYKVTIRLMREKALHKRGRNAIKILQFLVRKVRIRPKDMFMISHVAAEVTFENINDAHLCLDSIGNLSEESGISARIEARTLTCKGVITDWSDTILELWETITDHSKIFKLEKMYRRKWDKEKKTWTEEDTGNIIVTMKGSKIIPKLGLWDNTYHIKVRPYVSPVKQCYKCFRFGHTKEWCKSAEKCINCGDLKQKHVHELCTKPPSCVNCGGDHKSTYKGCQERERNRDLHVIMAFRNCSFKNAERIMLGRDTDPNPNITYDRYREPER